MLGPADIYVCLYLSSADEFRGYEYLSAHLEIALGTAHNAVKRLRASRLVVGTTVNKKALADFIVYGSGYVFYVKPGTSTRGVPTADAAPPLVDMVSPAESPLVWPNPDGTVRGLSVEPLHKSAPRVAGRDSHFYELLALTDAIRVGRARVRGLAETELRKRLAA